MTTPILIIGGGGHSKVLIEALQLRSVKILGILDADPAKTGMNVSGIRILGDDSALSAYSPDTVLLVNGIGSIHVPKQRMTVFEKFKAKGFTFATVIHPSAVVASDVILQEGVQIMAGAVIQPGSAIGSNTIVNTNVTVDHDCIIGSHVHLSPGVTLSGGVRIGTTVHLGTGATVIQGVKIGASSFVGAGAVIVTDIPNGSQVKGNSARHIATSIAKRKQI
jgi:sugar O-acyltransferase (sialic acid O-acetyltransferase NeuD family)